VIAVATTSLQQCTATTLLLSTLLHTALADTTTMINVPPPNPQCEHQAVAASTTAATSNTATAATVDFCALALNALLVVHEQLSYSKESTAATGAAATAVTAAAGFGTDSTTSSEVQSQSSSHATEANTARSLVHSSALIVLPDASSDADDSLCTVEQLAAVGVPHSTGVWIVQRSAILSTVFDAILALSIDVQQQSNTPVVTAYSVHGAVCAVRLNTAAVEKALLLAQADEFSQCYTAYDSGATAVAATFAEQATCSGLHSLVQRLEVASSADADKATMTTDSIQAHTVELSMHTAIQSNTSLPDDAATAAAAAALEKAQLLHNERFTTLQHELAALDSAAAAASPNCWSQSLAAIACRLQSAAAQATLALTNSSSSDSISSSAGRASGPGQHYDWRRAMAGAELCQDTTGKLILLHIPQCCMQCACLRVKISVRSPAQFRTISSYSFY
jgi:hypothetical protein